MKLNITTTETRQSEIVIGFPTFTKIVSDYKTEYYAVLNEEKLIHVSQFDNILGHLIESKDVNKAFGIGFKMIDKLEFENALNKVNSDTHKLTSNVLAEIKNLQFDNLSVEQRMSIPNNTITTSEDLQDKERAEYVESKDIERESKEIEIED